MDLTYGSYLQLDKILSAQKVESNGEHDETLFIIIHQVYELWFKQILHEGSSLAKSLDSGQTTMALHTLNRMLKILKTMVSQVDILETMTPLSFSQFRSYLKSSSGFQSLQFREFEIFMGKRPHALLDKLPQEEVKTAGLREKLNQPALFDYLLKMLSDKGYKVPQEALSRTFSDEYQGNELVQDTLLEIYREGGELALICESFVDMDEGIQEWRYRHVKMVERTIGHQMGTGGSPGVEYLKSTLFKSLFPDLWAVRSRF
jgi:tryptophan 2,3-dioxygenase